MDEPLAWLCSAARELEAGLAGELATREVSPVEQSQRQYATERLRRSVIRPLEEALERIGPGVVRAHQAGAPQAGAPPVDVDAVAVDIGGRAASLDERLWQLARDATRIRLVPGLASEVQEATAALQDLACQVASAEADERMAELRAIQAELPPGIRSQANGPYLVTNAEGFTNWLGERMPAPPQMALCRCGQSAIKPLCDGTHAGIAFSTEKDARRVPDRRDTYVGQQVTILDNRGTCQHSGLCTDRLASAFHLGEEPFVTPSGGRMDELIRAVRDCPSGALSYAMDGVEARAEVDYHGKREPAIEVSKDGPYRISGSIPLTGADGEDEPRGEAASREHYALCRCGHSQNKPFCSGIHWYVDFHHPVPDAGHEPTMFEWCGGLPALTRMTRLFYEKHVPQDPLLGPLFANMSADHPQRVAKWLGEVFGGPPSYSGEYGGYTRMISQHVGKCLTDEWRARWVSLLYQSAQEAGLPNDPEFHSAFSSYIEWGSRLAVENSQTGALPPEHMPMPHWDWDASAGAPGSRISALAPPPAAEAEVAEPVVLPAADEPVRFEKHIKPLFRPRDRQSMKFVFDLWAFDEVKVNADAILERLRNGSMPCDGAWPSEKIEVFERWVQTGMSG
ncbi:MAG: CDGSH iron-sulfur domain-containing protein [Actinomycetota bacterium]|nr:CDGSH iron-sulfur domain-containing protein [Actinomycetota bacterium]